MKNTFGLRFFSIIFSYTSFLPALLNPGLRANKSRASFVCLLGLNATKKSFAKGCFMGLDL